MPAIVVYLVPFFLATACSQSHPLPELQVPDLNTDCNIQLTVDSEHSSKDWLDQYTKFTALDTGSQNETLHLTMQSLQEALVALNETISVPTTNCVEVVIASGNYTMDKEITITQRNIRILAEEIGSVFIDFSVGLEPSSITVLSFLHADHVEISGIQFANSPGLVAVENVTSVQVAHSTFRWFDRGALDMYMCYITAVQNCTFENNGFLGATKYAHQYRGHAGGLSVGFDDNQYNVNGTDSSAVPYNRGVVVSDCVFRNNTSVPDQTNTGDSASVLLQSYVFTGRGGAIAISANTTFPWNAIIQNCIVEDSFALSFGGGIYLAYSGLSSHTTIMNNTVLTRNKCYGPAGGLQLGYVEGPNFFSSRFEVFNSVFTENAASFGGGIHLFSNQKDFHDNVQLSQSIFVSNCTFERNNASEFGSAMSVASIFFLADSSFVEPVIVKDCTFRQNKGDQALGNRSPGTLSTAYLPLSLQGENRFIENEGNGLLVSGSRVHIHGPLLFSRNQGANSLSAALLISSFGQLHLHQGARIVFENNSGLIGGSLVEVVQATLSRTYSQLPFNRLCVLQYEIGSMRPDEWENVSLEFAGNTAYLGSSVYLDTHAVDRCSWTGFGPEPFDPRRVFRWNFMSYSDNSNHAHFPNVNSTEFYVQTRPLKLLNVGNSNVTAYPGEIFSLDITGIDEFGLSVPTALTLAEEGLIFFSSPLVLLENANTNFSTSYTVINLRPDEEPSTKEVRVGNLEGNLNVPLTIIPKPCPVGFYLNSVPSLDQRTNTLRTFHTCECNQADNDYINACDGLKILLKDNTWSIESEHYKDRLASYQCPQRYCKCLQMNHDRGTVECKFELIDPTNPDQQCHCKRRGILCGSCRNDTEGFTALLNDCTSCGYENIIVILALVLLDLIVITILSALNVSPPGWIYPAVYYIQILPIVTADFPATFEVVHPYAYYLSSASSFYLVYDFCLGPQFSAIGVYFVRFIPFLISLAVATVGVIVRHQYKLVHKPWPGLWWLVLFQFTHTVHTCMSILNCPQLPGFEGDRDLKPRWYVNGDITCFEEGHIALALWAILVLLFCVAIIVVLFVYALARLEKPCWLANAITPMSSTFKDAFYWWGPMELIRRIMLIIMALASPGNDIPVIHCLMMSLVLCLFIQPYKSVYANLTEAFLASSIIVLLLGRGVSVDEKYLNLFYKLRDFNISGEDCLDSSVDAISLRSAVLAGLYFIPVIFFIIASVVGAVVLLLRLYRARRLAMVQSKSNVQEEVNHSSYFNASSPPAGTQSVEVSTHQIPLSLLIGRIFGSRWGPRSRLSRQVEESTSVEARSVQTLFRVQTQPQFIPMRTKRSMTHTGFSPHSKESSFGPVDCDTDAVRESEKRSSIVELEEGDGFEHIELQKVECDSIAEEDPFEVISEIEHAH